MSVVEIMMKKSFVAPSTLFDAVNQWRQKQPSQPTLSLALRSLLIIALRSEGVKI